MVILCYVKMYLGNCGFELVTNYEDVPLQGII
jgi:hypothetical protein